MTNKLVETLEQHKDCRASFLKEAIFIAFEAGKVYIIFKFRLILSFKKNSFEIFFSHSSFLNFIDYIL